MIPNRTTLLLAVPMLCAALTLACVAQESAPDDGGPTPPGVGGDLQIPGLEGKKPLTQLPDDGRYDEDYHHKYASAGYELVVPGKYLVRTTPDGRNRFDSFARHLLGEDPKGKRIAPPVLYLAKPAEGETVETAPAFTVVTVRKTSTWDASPGGGLKEKLTAFHKALGHTISDFGMQKLPSPGYDGVRLDYTRTNQLGHALPITRMLLPSHDTTYEIIIHRKARDEVRMEAEITKIIDGFRRYGLPQPPPQKVPATTTGTEAASPPPTGRWTRIAAWTGGAFLLGLAVHLLLTRLGKPAKGDSSPFLL